MTQQAQTLSGTGPTIALALSDRHLTLTSADKASKFHYIWLRDNCWCDECRVSQSGERRLFTAAIGGDIAPVEAALTDGGPSCGGVERRAHLQLQPSWLDENDYSNRADTLD